jgi:broad specificity phosphatase PhoE
MSARRIPILVLRHGQSEWNSIRRWQGTADSPLTELGRQQAGATAALLVALRLEFPAIWTSDLRRASETAAIIARRLGLGEPIVDARLREAHAGEWEGLTPEEIELRWPGWLEAHHRPTTFEPYSAVVARASEALSEVAGRACGLDPPAGLVVAHSGVVRSLIRHLGGIDTRIPNLGGLWFTASLIDGRPGSVTHGGADLALGDVFDPSGVIVTGVDAPGEDPGEEADEADTQRAAEG